ncbi:uncharacterized protein K02A2.6-like [Uloborus diversus]|uniref:uncharacterized protein K02A2.6-like n=1 Tax=Uloborus diversus TaxID=327109 RepID=UPI002409E231|nr:uncharacterized protein K02A2.6-like [Uloborus diversus]
MATYLMKFVPKFSQETSILRDLLKKDTNWIWDSHHDEAFSKVKDLLQSSTILQFFDRDKPIVLSVDATSTVINALKTCFARFGVPEEIVGDNGPPFDSKEFSEFCTSWDILHNPSSPGYPRSNGQVERCVQTIKSSLNKAAQDNKDPHLVLMEYRNTPMDGLPSPAEILMGRRIRTLIPVLPSLLKPHYDYVSVFYYHHPLTWYEKFDLTFSG